MCSNCRSDDGIRSTAWIVRWHCTAVNGGGDGIETLPMFECNSHFVVIRPSPPIEWSGLNEFPHRGVRGVCTGSRLFEFKCDKPGLNRRSINNGPYIVI